MLMAVQCDRLQFSDNVVSPAPAVNMCSQACGGMSSSVHISICIEDGIWRRVATPCAIHSISCIIPVAFNGSILCDSMNLYVLSMC